MYHKSVLLKESVEGLAIRPTGVYVDATFGGGGHAAAILAELTTGKLFAFDQDADALANKPDDPRFTFIHQNFRYMRNFLRLYNAIPVDGILADLGVSSYQIDEATRGFSTRFDGVLDMRMDRRQPLTAREIVNTYPEEKLKHLFRAYGELPFAGKLARAICTGRSEKALETTAELLDLIRPFAGKGRENKLSAQLFQALRIEVNHELEVLQEFLIQCIDLLKPGGRLVVISYHSLEDTLVKHFMRSGNPGDMVEKDFYGNVMAPLKPVSRKAIVAGEAEKSVNPRARSARMRIAEKIQQDE